MRIPGCGIPPRYERATTARRSRTGGCGQPHRIAAGAETELHYRTGHCEKAPEQQTRLSRTSKGALRPVRLSKDPTHFFGRSHLPSRRYSSAHQAGVLMRRG